MALSAAAALAYFGQQDGAPGDCGRNPCQFQLGVPHPLSIEQLPSQLELSANQCVSDISHNNVVLLPLQAGLALRWSQHKYK